MEKDLFLKKKGEIYEKLYLANVLIEKLPKVKVEYDTKVK